MEKLQTTPQYVSRSQNVSFLFFVPFYFHGLKDKITKIINPNFTKVFLNII